MLYLGYLTKRIPILPPFFPHGHHYDYDNGQDIPVGDILHELKATQAVPERWRRIRYDGESPQTKPNGRPYQIGDCILPEGVTKDSGLSTPRGEGDWEDLSCWSVWETIDVDAWPYSDRMNICTPSRYPDTCNAH